MGKGSKGEGIMKTQEEMRLEFEDFELQQYLFNGGNDLDVARKRLFEFYAWGRYKSEAMQNRWLGWQARQPEIDAKDRVISRLREVIANIDNLTFSEQLDGDIIGIMFVESSNIRKILKTLEKTCPATT
jgi:hypothetical protein